MLKFLNNFSTTTLSKGKNKSFTGFFIGLLLACFVDLVTMACLRMLRKCMFVKISFKINEVSQLLFVFIYYNDVLILYQTSFVANCKQVT